MNSQTRKILFYFFVFMFFALSAIILPYSFGYKLNFSGMKLQRTGMFDIKTTPSGATIYLNNKKQSNFLGQISGRESVAKTPIKLKNIIPGTYQIKLELDGYWPWEKQLIIKPGETTYLEDVYFFKKQEPTLLDSANLVDIKEIAVSGDRKHIAVLSDGQLKIFSWDKNQIVQTINLPKDIKGGLFWSPNNQKIACDRLIIDWRNQSLTDLKDIGINSINHLAWLDDNTFYFQEKDEIKRLNLKNNQLATTTFKKDIADFIIENGHLYIIYNGTQASLSINKINGNEVKELQKIKLKSYEKYRFIKLNSSNVNFQELSSKKLYTLNDKLPWVNDYSFKEIGALSVGQWVNSDKLIFSNNYELNLWTKDSDQSKMLTRISNSISALAWHKSNNYVVFATDKTINNLELDDRDTYSIATLLSLPKIDYPVFNSDGNEIFFFAEVNGQSGFYLLEI